MCDKHNARQVKVANHGVQIDGEAVVIVSVMIWLVGLPPAKKIEGNDAPTGSEKVWYKGIVQMHVIWEAVQQYDRRVRPSIFTGVEAISVAQYSVFYKTQFNMCIYTYLAPKKTVVVPRQVVVLLCARQFGDSRQLREQGAEARLAQAVHHAGLGFFPDR